MPRGFGNRDPTVHLEAEVISTDDQGQTLQNKNIIIISISFQK